MISMGAWIGSALTLLVLSLVKGQVSDSQELFAVNYCMSLIDNGIIVPAAILTLLTGISLCWLTDWGFTKFNWIIVKLVLTIAQILFGSFFLG
ncbi:MAG: hypothetical protein MJ157_04430, partial [Clostridia bacterium]|nr:hypothetical protein [Clostridia bacterium]